MSDIARMPSVEEKGLRVIEFSDSTKDWEICLRSLRLKEKGRDVQSSF